MGSVQSNAFEPFSKLWHLTHTDTHTQHTHINNSNVTDTWLTVNVKIKLIFQQLRWGKLNIFSGILIF